MDEPPDRGEEQTPDQNDTVVIHGWDIDWHCIC